MDIQFIASFAVIAPEPAESRKLYVDAIGLPLTAAEGDDYLHSELIDGAKHFGVWPLAQACVGFEVADPDAVQAAADELRASGFEPLHDAREEPWGQTVARLQSPEGAIVGISFAP